MQTTTALPKAEGHLQVLGSLPSCSRRGQRSEDPTCPSPPNRARQTHRKPTESRPIEAGQVDRAFHATLARLTGGISPVARSLAYFDWASHLAAAPQRRMEIAQDAVRTAGRIFESALHCTEPGYGPWSLIKPQPQDRRFAASEWESPPFNLLAQAFLLRRAMVAQRDRRRTRRGARKSGDRRVLGAAGARHAGAVQFCREQSRGSAEGLSERRREFPVRVAELVQRPDALGRDGSARDPASLASRRRWALSARTARACRTRLGTMCIDSWQRRVVQ